MFLIVTSVSLLIGNLLGTHLYTSIYVQSNIQNYQLPE